MESLVYLPEGTREDVRIQVAHEDVLFDATDPNAWDGLIASVRARRAVIFVKDTSDGLWEVLEVEPYPGWISGRLVLRNYGPHGTLTLDLGRAYGGRASLLSLPAVAYRPPRGWSPNVAPRRRRNLQPIP